MNAECFKHCLCSNWSGLHCIHQNAFESIIKAAVPNSGKLYSCCAHISDTTSENCGETFLTIFWVCVGVQIKTCSIRFKPAVLWSPRCVLDDCVMASHIMKPLTGNCSREQDERKRGWIVSGLVARSVESLTLHFTEINLSPGKH